MAAVSEGISDDKGVSIISAFTKEVDSHGNVQLSGSGALGDLLAGVIKSRTKITRVRADTLGYLQRSFPGVVSLRDSREARAVGIAAVKDAVTGYLEGSITIRRRPGRKYQVFLRRVPLDRVARETREMSPRFINKEGNDVTQAFMEYVTPLAGDLPPVARLDAFKVKL